jgi:hypothetical protein
MGSVIILGSSPASLHDAGNLSLERQAAEADAAHLELTQNAARAAADAATITLANLEFQFSPSLCELTVSSHPVVSP